MNQETRKTPFYAQHVERQGKLVTFAGWSMPVQFKNGIIHEHKVVRSAVGVFDVSHMARIIFRGPGAKAYVNQLVTNNVAKLEADQLFYSALCNDDGGIIDDVTVYNLGDEVLLVANAANADAVWDWCLARKPDDVEMINRTDALAQIALQGPKAEAILKSPFAEAVKEVGYYHYTKVSWQGEEILISRNGYTGEDGFEIYIPVKVATALWNQLFEWGAAAGIEPIGLGARDSLRMEVNYALYGNELSTEVTPLETGLRWVVKFKKGDFFGKDAMLARKKEGLMRTLVGFEVDGKRLPRHGYPIEFDGQAIGVVTSGGYCPSLDKGMGMGFVPKDQAAVGTGIEIDARGKKLNATIVDRPFYTDGTVRK
jgi:glycine cleavage system T protein (aminomethyltransferase)